MDVKNLDFGRDEVKEICAGDRRDGITNFDLRRAEVKMIFILAGPGR